MPDDAARLEKIRERYVGWHPVPGYMGVSDDIEWLLAQLAAREGDVEKLKAIADDVVSDWQREKRQADTLRAQLAAREAEVARLRDAYDTFSGLASTRREKIAVLETTLRTVAEAATAFRAKLTALMPAIGGAFAFQQVHGFPYQGENWIQELAALDAALALEAVRAAREETG